MAAQLATGYPALFPGKASYLIPTGFSVDQHKNAFLIVISYAFIQSYFIRNGYTLVAVTFFVVCPLFLLVSSSRAGLLTYVVTTAYIFMMGLKLRNLIMMLALTCGGLFLIYIVFAFYGAYSVIYDLLPLNLGTAYEAATMKYTKFFSDDSGHERAMLWMSLTNLNAIDSMKMLTFGLGPGSFDTMHSQTIHNTSLDVLVSVGAISLLSLGIIIFRIVRHAVSCTVGHDGFALSAVIISIVMFSMLHDFGRTRFLWVFLGLAACSYYRAAVTNSYNPYRSASHENPARGIRT